VCNQLVQMSSGLLALELLFARDLSNGQPNHDAVRPGATSGGLARRAVEHTGTDRSERPPPQLLRQTLQVLLLLLRKRRPGEFGAFIERRSRHRVRLLDTGSL